MTQAFAPEEEQAAGPVVAPAVPEEGLQDVEADALLAHAPPPPPPPVAALGVVNNAIAHDEAEAMDLDPAMVDDGAVPPLQSTSNNNQENLQPQALPLRGSNNNSSSVPGDNLAAVAGASSARPSALALISVGMFLEVRDTVGKWCEAEVMSVNHGARRLRITYMYWSDKYDEELPFDSDRLAPYQTHCYRENQPQTLEAGQRVEVLDPERANKWGEAEVAELSADGTMVRVTGKRLGRPFDEWLPRTTPRLRAYGRFKKCLADKQSNKARMAVAAAPTPTAGSSAAPRPPLATIGGTHQNAQARHGKSRVDLNDQHLRAIAASSDRYDAYQAALARQELEIQPIEGDGNCLFRSVSHQVYGTEAHHLLVRQKCMDYMEVERQYFEPYVVGDMADFLRYLELKRRDGIWGDDPEVQALCELYDRPAEIWAYDAATGAKKLRTFHEASGFTARSELCAPMMLSYYGGGHYDSLVWQDPSKRHVAPTLPGVLEDRAIEMARQRHAALSSAGSHGGGVGIEETKRRSDEEATEQAAVEAALKASREDFDSFTDLETALEMSAEALFQAQLLKSAAEQSEEELVKKVLEDSLKEGGLDGMAVGDDAAGAGGVEEEMLRVAMQQSLADGGGDSKLAAPTDDEEEYQRALKLSMAEFGGGLPGADEAAVLAAFAGEDTELAAAIALSLKQHEEQHVNSAGEMVAAPLQPPLPPSSSGLGTATGAASILEQQQWDLELAQARKEEEDLRRALAASLDGESGGRGAARSSSSGGGGCDN